jgi:multidrug efflux system outer membrane protein
VISTRLCQYRASRSARSRGQGDEPSPVSSWPAKLLWRAFSANSFLPFCGLSLLGLLLCQTGCKVGPDYQRPAPLGTNAMPPAYSGPTATNDTAWKPAEPSAHLPRGVWWKIFADPELDRLEDFSGANNQQLAVALARFDEARASFNVTRADLFPQVALDPSYVRQRTSFNQPSDGHAAGISPTYNTFTMQLQAGWEVDLWGRVRRQVEGARDRIAASAADV